MFDDGLQRVIDRTAAAAEAFANGDAGDYASLWSAGDDVTIFGGFGSGERGRDEIVARLAWASARFRSGEIVYEPITSGRSGDLGYAVGIERGRVQLAAQDEPGEVVLRVTHLFRREEGEWRLIHRHADSLASVIPPTAMLQDSADGAAR